MPANLTGRQGEPGRTPRPSEFWRRDEDESAAGPPDQDACDSGPRDAGLWTGDRRDPGAHDTAPRDADVWTVRPRDADVWTAGPPDQDARDTGRDADVWTAGPRDQDARDTGRDADGWAIGPRDQDARPIWPGSADGRAAGGFDASSLDGASLDGASLDGASLDAATDKADGQAAEQRRARHVSGVRVIRRPWAAAVALAGVVIAGAAAAGFVWASQTPRPATPLGQGPLVPIPAGHWAAAPAAVAAAVPKPTALEIPAIGVRTRLIRLGITATGALQVPVSIAVAGWYTGSPRPGATGSAVIAGHIDSVRGPGVFFRLRELRPGDLVYVQRGHASMAVFKVTAVRMILKSKFPTNAVYGPVPNAQLRLITCGGTFDPATGHYLSNVIVFAVLQ